MSEVGMAEDVKKIEIHFRNCYAERQMLYAREAFINEFDTIREAVLTPECDRTPYMKAIMEEVDAVEAEP